MGVEPTKNRSRENIWRSNQGRTRNLNQEENEPRRDPENPEIHPRTQNQEPEIQTQIQEREPRTQN